MGQLITVEELPRYAPGELILESPAMGNADFRLRVFRYAPSDIWVPPTDSFLIVLYREGTTSMNRRVTGAWEAGSCRPRHHDAADACRSFELAMEPGY